MRRLERAQILRPWAVTWPVTDRQGSHFPTIGNSIPLISRMRPIAAVARGIHLEICDWHGFPGCGYIGPDTAEEANMKIVLHALNYIAKRGGAKI